MAAPMPRLDPVTEDEVNYGCGDAVPRFRRTDGNLALEIMLEISHIWFIGEKGM
jgi:hypothetical protein